MPPLSTYESASLCPNNAEDEHDILCRGRKEMSSLPLHKRVTSGDQRISKSVRFHPAVRAKKHLHINNFTKEEVEASFYNSKEYKAIKYDVKFIGEMISEGTLEEDSDKYCRRGLEGYIPGVEKSRLQAQSESIASVLENQDLCLSAYEIACIYEEMSCRARAKARSLGLRDELQNTNEVM